MAKTKPKKLTPKKKSIGKNIPTKENIGRPSEFKDDYTRMAYVACSEVGGFTNVKLAKLFGVSVTTIKTWKKERPEFLTAVNTGKDIWDALIAEKSLLKRVAGFRYTETTREAAGEVLSLSITKKVSKIIPPDVKACDIWLCNRNPERWRKLKHIELTGKDGADLFKNLSDEELDQRIADKLAESHG